MGTILVFGGDIGFQHDCEQALKSEGWNPQFVSSEKGVLDFIRERSGVDIVILNVRSAGENFHQVLERLRQIKPHLSVILTADYFSYWNDFSTWLADACLVTSPDFSELKETVRHFMVPDSALRNSGPECGQPSTDRT
jgi:DNA-binding NtrC family response regulator